MEGAVGGGGNFADASDGAVAVGFDGEGVNITNFVLSGCTIAVFLDGVAVVDGSGALEIAEGFAEGLVAATQDPVDDFAFAHIVKVVHSKIVTEHHRFDDVSNEVAVGAVDIVEVFSKEWEGILGEFFSNGGIGKAKFINVVLIFKHGEIIRKTLNLVESPSFVSEITVGQSVFNAVGGETRKVVIGEWIEAIIRDFTGHDFVAFELATNSPGITNDLGSAVFDRFLSFGVVVHNVDAMFEGGRSDVMKEAGESLLFVVSEAPE